MPAVFTPLWPAGHLPLKGGDWQVGQAVLNTHRLRGAGHSGRSISPLEGEMAGRPEGGIKPSMYKDYPSGGNQ
jgi:cobaltochelatase CobN